jgi:hypothetical protein
MFNWINVTLLAIILTVVGVIAVAIRNTLSSIYKDIGPAPSQRRMRQAIETLRSEEVSCPRCGRQTSSMPGRNGFRKCDSCSHELENAAT